jgi:hypothetical protein
MRVYDEELFYSPELRIFYPIYLNYNQFNFTLPGHECHGPMSWILKTNLTFILN